MRVIVKQSPDKKMRLYKCPKCGEIIKRDHWGEKSCPYCKGIINWSGTGNETEPEEMTEEQRELCYTIQLGIIKGIMSVDIEDIWKLIKKSIDSKTGRNDTE